MSDAQCRIAIFFGILTWSWLAGALVGESWNPLNWSDTAKTLFAFIAPFAAIWMACVPVKLGKGS